MVDGRQLVETNIRFNLKPEFSLRFTESSGLICKTGLMCSFIHLSLPPPPPPHPSSFPLSLLRLSLKCTISVVSDCVCSLMIQAKIRGCWFQLRLGCISCFYSLGPSAVLEGRLTSDIIGISAESSFVWGCK